MDDLNGRLDALLNDPNLSDKINSVLSSLSDADKKEEAARDSDPGLPPIDIAAISSLLGALEGNDNDLLRALAPYLRPKRREKINEAQRLMSVLRLLPLLGDLGKKE